MQSNIANTKDKTNNNLTIIVSSLAEVVIIIAVAIWGYVINYYIVAIPNFSLFLNILNFSLTALIGLKIAHKKVMSFLLRFI
jgi:hypothetical protein